MYRVPSLLKNRNERGKKANWVLSSFSMGPASVASDALRENADGDSTISQAFPFKSIKLV